LKCITQRLRAIDDNEKALKRQSILDAAARIFAKDLNNLPSVISIAKASGLAKGTVYLYFKTKEEIFLALLSEQYETLLLEILSLLDSEIENKYIIPELITILTRFMALKGSFMPLASMANTVIEKNVERDVVAQFKLMLVKYLKAVGASLHQRFPHLSTEKGIQLLLHTNALIIGLWQMQSWPENLKELMCQPELKIVSPEFFPEMVCALNYLWRGSLLNHEQS
jgi:AcrR family transcriptional regulator